MKLTHESKVGALVTGTVLIVIGFAWLLGFKNPFRDQSTFYVTYNFAGGIDLGSHVRLSGIKVGKVEDIEFFAPAPNQQVSVKEHASADRSVNLAYTPVRLKISVKKAALPGVRKNSNFYINLAGLIGERYIEITPGTIDSPVLAPGETVAGVDPPRIDQLISQSFNLAGKIQELIEQNKGDITRSIELLYKLSANLNRTLEKIDQSKILSRDLAQLITNLMEVTADVHEVTKHARSPEGQRTLKLLHDLLWRLEPLDSVRIREFLQKEGVRVRVF
ncbi:MCE family protein [bacterium]|jgi:phospholipid/cholesterol/gamma-HCH transport system substrate-binding protein|nr:MCE family protein [bacterium]